MKGENSLALKLSLRLLGAELPSSSYEHTGQFYVASDGIWDAAGDGTNTGIDIFGYAPKGIGSYLPYQGVGIKGAPSSKGGTGRPRFGQMQLNSTGEFPALGGLYIGGALTFDGNGPQMGNIITPPLATSLKADEVIIFAPTATMTGASQINYINGYARVINPTGSFTLPIGCPTMRGSSLHPLIINQAVRGSITSRYLPSLHHPSTAHGNSIAYVYPTSNWQIDAPAGTGFTVTLADTLLAQEDTQTLRLVDDGTVLINATAKRYFRVIEDQGVDVKWFGAKGDGVTDDVLAIRKAVSTVTAEGLTLIFPAGVYNISDSIKIDLNMEVLLLSMGAAGRASLGRVAPTQ